MTGFTEKLLELVKASGWQTFFLSIAFGAFIYLVSHGSIDLPAEYRFILPFAWLGALICGALALSAVAEAIAASARQPIQKIRSDSLRRKKKREFATEIAFLTDHERQILGYFREKQIKRFEADQDAGHAATLLAKGFIRRASPFASGHTRC